MEYAWIAFALLAGATLAGWPYLRLLLAGLRDHFAAIDAVLESALP